MSSFYSREELAHLGLARCGNNVLLSRKASLYSPERMELGDNIRIDDFCVLSGTLKIGSYVHIAAFCGLFGSEGITLQDYAGLSSRVSIYTVSEDYLGNGLTNPTIPARFRHPVIGPVLLQKHVIIGAGSVILPGVTIGTGTAVGALALVSADCEPWKIYAGVPARIRKDRRRDIILQYQAELESTRTG